jgi:hypothetical protein
MLFSVGQTFSNCKQPNVNGSKLTVYQSRNHSKFEMNFVEILQKNGEFETVVFLFIYLYFMWVKILPKLFFLFLVLILQKLFFSVPNIMSQYTREFVPGKPFQPSLRYVVQPGARLIMLEQGKHSSLFCQSVRDGENRLRKRFHLIANFWVQIWSITHWESDWERKRKELTEKVREEYWITCQMWNQLSKLRGQCYKTFFQVKQTWEL